MGLFVSRWRSHVLPSRWRRWRLVFGRWRWRRKFWWWRCGIELVAKMRTKEFLSKLEHDQIVSAIREAESKTSGEIRVFIQRGKLDADPLIVAQKKFQRLGMFKTRERNAVP